MHYLYLLLEALEIVFKDEDHFVLIVVKKLVYV